MLILIIIIAIKHKKQTTEETDMSKSLISSIVLPHIKQNEFANFNKILGNGASGVVLKSFHIPSCKVVALKVKFV